jgi:16S rRNA (guanine1207-N2)-methyltransferase
MISPIAPLLADPAPRDARLSLAIDGGLTLPDGPVTVLAPRAGERFDPLPMARLQMVQGFRPDHDALVASGYSVYLTPPPAPTALVCVPRAKALAMALIAQAASGSELVLVDGQKTDGIDSIYKDIRARVEIAGNITKAHGRLFWFDPRGADLSDLRAAPGPVTTADGRVFQTGAGVFSADGVDPGSALLADALPADLPSHMVDLGAGWGYLSAQVLSRRGPEVVHLLEADATALDAARQNIPDPRAQFHWVDVTSFTPPPPVNGIVMNPPFHTGRAAQPALGQAFIAAAARMLTSRGHLWMVANRHLPYDPTLASLFAEVTILTQTPTFKVWHARNPRRGGARMASHSKG